MSEKQVKVQSLASSLVALKWTIIGLVVMLLVKNLMSAKRDRNRKKLPGKVVIVTGANSGIGYATALDLAKRKARVILACRDKRKGEEAAAKIRRNTKNKNVLFRQLDLASCDSVRRFCRAIVTSEMKLDVLVNNACVMACRLSRSEDGHEMQLAVNHLGHFLLTNLLLNLLVKSEGKIVNVASHLYRKGRINFDDLNSDECLYDSWRAYYQSKLAEVIFTKELSRRLRGTNVTVNAVYPGLTATNLRRHTLLGCFIVRYLLAPVIWLMWRTPEQSGLSIVSLLVSGSLDDQTGMYFANGKTQPIAERALDEKVAKKLWEASLKLVGLKKSTF